MYTSPLQTTTNRTLQYSIPRRRISFVTNQTEQMKLLQRFPILALSFV